MNRNLVSLCLFGLISLLATSPVTAVTIATVPVGSPGNAPDPATGNGAVSYNYRIGTYDVTNAQYVEFLNAKASATDPFGLWNPNMDPSNGEGAIARSGSGPFTYSVRPGYANKPVVNVNWYNSIRFVNWLTNGQGSGDTESGTYALTDGGNSVAIPNPAQRAAWAASGSAHWLLPSESEWYKAAYFNSASGTYYAFPFQSVLQPQALSPPGNTNSGNFLGAASNYDGTGSSLTDVGSYPNSLSPSGAFDMGGDVWQWDETFDDMEAAIPGHRIRGSGWDSNPSWSSSTSDYFSFPISDGGSYDIGFRVALVGGVPEPSTGLLAVLACGLAWWMRKSFKRVA
jgi:sulfatase modifying factor 1